MVDFIKKNRLLNNKVIFLALSLLCFCLNSSFAKELYEITDGAYLQGATTYFQFEHPETEIIVGCGPVVLAELFTWHGSKGYPKLINKHYNKKDKLKWKALTEEVYDLEELNPIHFPKWLGGDKTAVSPKNITPAIKEFFSNKGYEVKVKKHKIKAGEEESYYNLLEREISSGNPTIILYDNQDGNGIGIKTPDSLYEQVQDIMSSYSGGFILLSVIKYIKNVFVEAFPEHYVMPAGIRKIKVSDGMALNVEKIQIYVNNGMGAGRNSWVDFNIGKSYIYLWTVKLNAKEKVKRKNSYWCAGDDSLEDHFVSSDGLGYTFSSSEYSDNIIIKNFAGETCNLLDTQTYSDKYGYDLEISNVQSSYSAEEDSSGDVAYTVNITADISNVGEHASTPGVLIYSFDEGTNFINKNELEAIEPGDTSLIEYSFEVDGKLNGSFPLKEITLNTRYESDIANYDIDELNDSITYELGADLELIMDSKVKTLTSHSYDFIEEDTKVTVTCDIKNIGNVETYTTVNVKFFVNGVVEDSVELNNIEAGDFDTAKFTYFYINKPYATQEDSLVVGCAVDYPSKIEELDPDNNYQAECLYGCEMSTVTTLETELSNNHFLSQDSLERTTEIKDDILYNAVDKGFEAISQIQERYFNDKSQKVNKGYSFY